VRYRIERTGVARFGAQVREHHVQLRIAPWDDDLQLVTVCALEIEPAVAVAEHRDGFGNRVHRFAVIAPHERLASRFTAEAETRLANPYEFGAVAPARELEWIAHSLHQAPRLWDFVLHRSPLTPELAHRVGEDSVPAYDPGRPLIEQVQGLLGWIGERYEADRSLGPEARPLDNLVEGGRGGPADLAHLLICLLRGWGIPARFAQGYLDPARYEPDEDAGGPGAEPLAQIMYPWVEALIPGAGWRGFDPSRGLLADEAYIKVAVGRDAGDVRAERSTYKGEVENEDATVEIQVTRLD
jgi:transglutaminase-like putative cysteine protease